MSSNTISSLASATAAAQLRPGNPKRTQLIIQNESTAVMYVALDGAVSLTSYSFQIAAGALLNLPTSYTGPVWALWASANGNARVTDI